MSNDWQDRVIRGGAIVVGAMGIIGAMVGLPGIMAGYPWVGWASVIILAVAAGIGLSCVAAVSCPRLSRMGRRRHRDR